MSFKTGNDPIDAILESYYDDLLELAEAAERGDITEEAFVAATILLVQRYSTRMYAAADGDISKIATIDDWKRQQEISANRLADDIYNGRYSARSAEDATKGNPEQTDDEAKAKLANRLALWAVSLGTVFSLATITRPGEIDLATGEVKAATSIWRIDPLKENCYVCLALDGVVLANEDWERLASMGIYPRSRSLPCAGYNCGCALYPIDLEPLELSTVLRTLRL